MLYILFIAFSFQNSYQDGQEYFTLNVVQEARISFEHVPDEIEMMDGDKKDFTIRVDGANPPPTIEWFINAQKLKSKYIKVIRDGSPKGGYKYGPSTSSFSQTIRYMASSDHNGKQLICIAKQTDAENNVSVQRIHTLLHIKAYTAPVQESLGVGIIAVIVSIACFILLALILLFVAFRTGRWCFKQTPPATILIREVEAPKPNQNSTEVQADMNNGSAMVDMGVGADFGPVKPPREQMDSMAVPLLQAENIQGNANEENKKLESILVGADDELKRYCPIITNCTHCG